MLKTENDSIKHMPRKEIRERLMALDETMPVSYAQHLAGKWKRAAQRRDLGFYEAARILGIYTDATPRTALRSVRKVTA